MILRENNRILRDEVTSLQNANRTRAVHLVPAVKSRHNRTTVRKSREVHT
jgi:hypothetical protein